MRLRLPLLVLSVALLLSAACSTAGRPEPDSPGPRRVDHHRGGSAQGERVRFRPDQLNPVSRDGDGFGGRPRRVLGEGAGVRDDKVGKVGHGAFYGLKLTLSRNFRR